MNSKLWYSMKCLGKWGSAYNEGKTLPWVLSHDLKFPFEIRSYEDETVINPTVQNRYFVARTIMNSYVNMTSQLVFVGIEFEKLHYQQQTYNIFNSFKLKNRLIKLYLVRYGLLSITQKLYNGFEN